MKRSRQMLKMIGLSLLLVGDPMRSVGQVQGSVRSVFVRILPDRVEPASLSVTSGRLRLIVQNRSTAPNLTLQFGRLNGPRIRTITMTPGQQLSIQTYLVIAGNYVLSEANHSAWQCKMNVQ